MKNDNTSVEFTSLVGGVVGCHQGQALENDPGASLLPAAGELWIVLNPAARAVVFFHGLKNGGDSTGQRHAICDQIAAGPVGFHD